MIFSIVFWIGVLSLFGGMYAAYNAIIGINSQPAVSVTAWAALATMGFVFALLCLVTSEFGDLKAMLKERRRE